MGRYLSSRKTLFRRTVAANATSACTFSHQQMIFGSNERLSGRSFAYYQALGKARTRRDWPAVSAVEFSLALVLCCRGLSFHCHFVVLFTVSRRTSASLLILLATLFYLLANCPCISKMRTIRPRSEKTCSCSLSTSSKTPPDSMRLFTYPVSWPSLSTPCSGSTEYRRVIKQKHVVNCKEAVA